MAQKRLLVLIDRSGWAYWRRAMALKKYSPKDWRVDVSTGYGSKLPTNRYDVCLQLYYGNVRGPRKVIDDNRLKTKLATGFNRGWDPSRLKNLGECLLTADLVFFNNLDMFTRIRDTGNVAWVSNGVDLEEFHVKVPIANRKPKVLWTGSRVHRKLKGYTDILMDLEGRLLQEGIEADFRLVDSHRASTQLRGESLVNWYNSGTVYVVASRNEGTPNPALEAAACGCTVVATRVGNMPELIDGTNGFLVDRNLCDIYRAVKKAVENYPAMATAMQATIAGWHWKSRAREYFAAFNTLLEQPDAEEPE